jgi:hypothetical protein
MILSIGLAVTSICLVGRRLQLDAIVKAINVLANFFD